jgi:hypothetical protein
VTVAAATSLLVTEGTSQERDPTMPIRLHDKNGDGRISRSEWPNPNFDVVDKDKDGFLTPEDFARHWNVLLPSRPSATASAAEKAADSTASRECPDGRDVKWIDTHVHVPGRRGPVVDIPSAVAAAAGAMDDNLICRIILMPVPGLEAIHPPQVLEDFLAEARKYPQHFFVMGGGGSLNSMMHDESGDGHVDDHLKERFAARSEAILGLGAIGFGEVGVLHLAAFNGQEFEEIPGDHPLLLMLADITARHHVVIDVHFDLVVEEMATPNWLPQPPNPPMLRPNLEGFERFLSHNSNARIVWAHLGSDFVGFRTPELTRRMLESHPNLYMSLRLGPGQVPSNHPMTSSGIKSDWLQLFEEFPDRFVIGTDQIFSLAGGPLTAQHERQRTTVRNETNRFLSYLPSELARQIAWENAVRIYKLEL